ncbi:MAG TPA: winged helix-turn-helix domain-containing protein [Candidatus Paceibacterota bacterium]|nr:winged helix-turn-helix domain-containing protein [Candidatus Paceibacterota bacterium]
MPARITASPAKAASASALFRALADPRRIALFLFIARHPGQCVSDAARATRMSVALASHHLKQLAQAGLVAYCPDGKEHCFGIADRSLAARVRAIIRAYPSL